MIDDGEQEGEQLYPDSGLTYKWVSVLRAAEVNWNKDGDLLVFRMREEGTVGESPQIIVNCWNR